MPDDGRGRSSAGVKVLRRRPRKQPCIERPSVFNESAIGPVAGPAALPAGPAPRCSLRSRTSQATPPADDARRTEAMMPVSSLARAACLFLIVAFGSSSAVGQGPGLQAIGEEVWSGQVTEVSGADTLVILYGTGSHQFKLDGIRPPRDLPALSDRAAELLRERLVGKGVQVRVRGYLDGARCRRE
jgi:hypothetical protein